MWSVVVFEKDNSVEAVPSCWYINGRCFWPKKSKHCKKLLERRSIPNSIEYDLFTARRLSLNINSLTAARQKASKAQISSDLSSADDDIQTRKERKKKQSPSLSPELPIKKKPAHTITSPPLLDSSDSNDEEVNIQLLDENKGQTKNKVNMTTPIAQKPIINRNLFDCFSESNTKKKIALNSNDDSDITDIDYTKKEILEDQRDYGSSSIYISSHSEPSRKLASFSQSNESKVENCKSSNYKNTTNISASTSISNLNTIERDDSNSYNYAKQSLRICTNLKYDVKRLHDGQDYLKMMVDKIFNQLSNQTNSNSDSHSLNHYDIPHITNENDLNEWEDTLKDS